MPTGFEKLLKVLIESGLHLPPEDVADALWLSTRLFDEIEVDEQAISNLDDKQVPQVTATDDILTKNETTLQKTKKNINFDDFAQDLKGSSEANLHTLGDSEKGRKIRGHPVRLPAAPTLPHMLEIERALRPLAKRKPSKHRWELDEKETADFIASSNLWNIVQRPSAERWLEGVLVVEQSPTMRLWQETAREFRQLMWRVGAFRWLETVHLDAYQALPRLTSPINATKSQHPLSICRPDSPRVIFVCTDSLSNAWLSGKIPELIALWGKYHTVVILHMLPEHMWRRTSLRRADFVTGSAVVPLSIPRVHNNGTSFNKAIIPIPVVSLQPESLRDLSEFLIASVNNQISCYWNSPANFRETTGIPSISPSRKFQPNTEFSIKSFEFFKETVSPVTLELARYLAIVPLFLPVMRLIQYTFIPNSEPAHLAELFNSGILFRVSPSVPKEHPNQIEYDFLPGIRETLLNQRSRPLISNVWKVLSDYIDDRFGRGKEFLSIIYDPTSTEEYVSGIRNEAQLPFARVGATVLRRLGDEYEHAAKYLERAAQDRHTEASESVLEEYSDAYRLAEIKIEEAERSGIKEFSLVGMGLTSLPVSIGKLTQLEVLDLHQNSLEKLPESVAQLTRLISLDISNNKFSDLQKFIIQLDRLKEINLDNNPLNQEVAKAYEQGIEAIKNYLRSKFEAGQVTLNEAKLIIVGEGEVGKSSLLRSLCNELFIEGSPTTHGIEIKPFRLFDPNTQKEISLNGWDFGGQRVYRPTHQLFFSAPAVYLVVWKPREGPQQGFVKEWIKLVKHREPDAKILVVATHGGPQGRQPDIDRQELWDLFGRETVVDFFFVDNKPDTNGNRKGIEELKLAIARVAAQLPEVGRSVPKSFQDVREALQNRDVPYLLLEEFLAICRNYGMADNEASLFVIIEHRLGHLTYYQHDPTLRDIVILRPDWLATAISYILDDESTRTAHGLVRFSRLSQLWDDPTRPVEMRYPATLHPILLRLMERLDLSYRVADFNSRGTSDPQSLIAQLVPDNRPENLGNAWSLSASDGDLQQTQICRIVDDKGNTATAEGLFYQLIVRLHKYSLGRTAYTESVHWQRGLILDDDYNGRALLELKGNDVHITVRAPYPERFLAMLTEEVKYLVESFWEGLRCDVTVPCLNPNPCNGLFEVSKLIEHKKQGRPEQPCPICNEWQSIDQLLLNSPVASQPIALDELERQFATIRNQLNQANVNTSRILSQIDRNYTDLLRVFTDEAKEGPRLFSLFPAERSNFDPRKWTGAKFRLVLWCEHSRLPLPVLNGKDSGKGIYDLDLEREWIKKASPYLKLLSSTLSMVLPIASSTAKLALLDDTAYKSSEEQLDLGKSVINATIGETEKIDFSMIVTKQVPPEQGLAIRGDGTTLRELHALLRAKDPGCGGLIRVLTKRQEFLWVHERFASEY